MIILNRVAAVLLVLVGAPGHAMAEDKLSCQAELRLPDCTAVGEVWSASGPLHVAVSCQICSIKGSEVSCSPGEQATAASLSVETAQAKVVEGTFTEVGGCEIGLKLFRFGGALATGESYVLVITVPGHPRTALINFSVASNISGGDGGTPSSTVDSGPHRDLTMSSTEAGLPPPDAIDAGAIDADAAEADGGCNCRTTAASPLSLSFLLLLALLLPPLIHGPRSRQRLTAARVAAIQDEDAGQGVKDPPEG